MSFQIQFMQNHSPMNAIAKSLPTSDTFYLEGTLRDGADILNPVILVQTTTNQLKERLLQSNYACIPEFNGRNYFITDISSYRNNLWLVSMSVDVLVTYQSQILNTYAIIARTEDNVAYTDGGYYLPDDNIPLSSNDAVIEYDPDNLSSVTSFGGILFSNCCVTWFTEKPVRKGGEDGLGRFSDSIVPIGSADDILPNVYPESFPFRKTKTYVAILTDSQMSDLADLVYQHEVLRQYIISAYVFPFELIGGAPTGETLGGFQFQFYQSGELTESIRFSGGYPLYQYTASDGTTKSAVSLISKRYLIADFTFSFYNTNSFLDYPPYSAWQMYLPFYGWIDLPVDITLNNARVKVYYTPSYTDGKCLIHVLNTTQKKILWFGECQLGVPIDFASTDALSRNLQIGLNAINFGLSAVTFGTITAGSQEIIRSKMNTDYMSLLTQGTGLNPTADYMNAAYQGGLMTTSGYMSNNLLSNASSLISSVYTPVKATGIQPVNGLANYNYLKVRIRCTRKLPYMLPDDSNYRKMYGTPCGTYHKIGDLSGFIKCDAFRLEGFTGATETELLEIDRILRTGFIH